MSQISSNSDDSTEDDPAKACRALIERMRTLQLATVDPAGTPHCGCTPFLFKPVNKFYVFVSQLSVHTRDLASTGKAAVLVIDDEQASQQIFARTRATFQCAASSVSAADPHYEALLDDYQERHGKMAGLLRQLPDFQLFCLTPDSAQFVMGFGKAYKLVGADLSEFEHTRTG